MTLLPKIVCAAGVLYDAFLALPNRAVSLTSKRTQQEVQEGFLSQNEVRTEYQQAAEECGYPFVYPFVYRFLPQ